MALSPLLIFWILLAGAVVVTAVSRYLPRLARGTAVGVLALVWLVWWLLRQRLPILATTAGSSPLPLVWQMDEMAWQLSGVWLLLVTAVLLAAGDRRETPYHLPLAAFLLAAAGLAPLLAGNLATLLFATTLLIGIWSAVLWLAEAEIHEDATRLLPQGGWLMLSLPLIWLAAAMAPEQGSGGWAMANWPTAATSSVLTAAWLLMGVWPLHGWRSLDWRLPPALAALIHAAPALAGLSLLARLVAGTDVSLGYSFFLTAFGLLGLLIGLRRVWMNPSPEALALAQVNWAGLALVWVGPDVALAEARVLALALGIVFLVSKEKEHGFTRGNANYLKLVFWIRQGAAAGAMAGLPAMAGFAGRAGLYAAWVANGRFILLLVAVLVQMLLVTAVLLATGKSEEAGVKRPMAGATLLLAAGLVSFSGLANAPAWVWLALLLPFIGGVALSYFTDETAEFQAVVRQAFTVNLPLDLPRQWTRNLVGWLETAVRDAAAIWEGEGGLLWLLALLILFLMT